MGETDPLAPFRKEAVALAAEALHAVFGLTDRVDHLLETPDPDVADYAIPCFAFAKKLQKAPPAIAAELPAALPRSELLHVAAVGPYLNFRIRGDALAKQVIASVQARGERYGHARPGGSHVLVEHTSANPTGPLHVGRARNPLLADTLVRILRAAGHRVTAEYYVNDMGRQAATLAYGASRMADAADASATKGDHRLVGAYQAASAAIEEDDQQRDAMLALIGRFEQGDEEAAALFREPVSEVLQGIRATLARAGVKHDNFKFESELVLDGQVDDVLSRLRKHEAAGEEDGAVFLDLERLGVETEKTRMFLTRADGTTLYGCRDVAYHRDKFARADELVNVLGEDHKLAMLELTTALRALGEERPVEVVFYNFVSLPEGKMSTRAGRTVYLDDLLDEAEARAYEEVKKRRGDELSEDEMRAVATAVGVGALRFNLVAVQSEKAITFRWEDALAFDGATAPFVQYSHARTCSILAKAGVESGATAAADPSRLEHESEQTLLRLLGALPGVVREAAGERRTHLMPAYGVRVAGAFNDFYRDCPVLNADTDQRRMARIALVDATRQVLANTLDLIGVEAPRSM